jgi:hypothetical protein
MNDSSSISFAKVRFYVADIQAMLATSQIVKFVFSPYYPGSDISLGLIAYAQTESNGQLSYPGVPLPLTFETEEAISIAGAVIITNNYIAASNMQALIQGLNDSDFLLFEPAILANTNYLYYNISTGVASTGGGTGTTNPSPPATM